LAAAPLSFAVFSLGELAFRRAQRFRRERGTSNDAKLRSRTSEADAACRGQDAAVALGAIVRALETATELLVGLNVRGIAVDTVARELEAQGVAYELAGRIQKILEACGGARFSPEGSDIAFARRQWEEATRALRDLHKLGKLGKG
jgi:hypothetical protein